MVKGISANLGYLTGVYWCEIYWYNNDVIQQMAVSIHADAQNGWFIMRETPTNLWMIWGYLYIRKPQMVGQKGLFQPDLMCNSLPIHFPSFCGQSKNVSCGCIDISILVEISSLFITFKIFQISRNIPSLYPTSSTSRAKKRAASPNCLAASAQAASSWTCW